MRQRTKLPAQALCPVCPTRIQPPSGEWVAFADRHAQELGYDLPGPLLLSVIGGLICHHAMVHDELPLNTLIDAYYDA